ncbi:MAG: MerR family DNA-binding transcriptional regulator [Promethearchaeota archaeon]
MSKVNGGRESRFLSIGAVARMLGVCTRTLRRWEGSGKFTPSHRTVGNHRRYAGECHDLQPRVVVPAKEIWRSCPAAGVH